MSNNLTDRDRKMKNIIKSDQAQYVINKCGELLDFCKEKFEGEPRIRFVLNSLENAEMMLKTIKHNCEKEIDELEKNNAD